MVIPGDWAASEAKDPLSLLRSSRVCVTGVSLSFCHGHTYRCHVGFFLFFFQKV
jgi:hypothetical protein